MPDSHSPQPLTSKASGPIKGTVTVPGDKSISHRSLMLSSQGSGKSTIHGLLEGEDVLNTAKALASMGIESGKNPDGSWWVNGRGVGALSAPASTLDLGNSGTSTRLLMGLMGSYDFNTRMTGDASLKKRPMARVMEPLKRMGVNFETSEGSRLPLTVLGTSDTVPITAEMKVASAQVKSAVLLCALNTQGITTVIEREATRDHTERMLKFMGADIETSKGTGGETIIRLNGQPELKACIFNVPGDSSSAAFPTAAALLAPGSDILLKNTCLNPLRTGFYQTLQEMGAVLSYEKERMEAGEKTADIRVKFSALKGVRVPSSRAPSMIDEYPILAVLASCADGTTVMEGLGELRVKESDRLAMIAAGLKACGAKVEIEGDNLIVHGNGNPPAGGAIITTSMDHRIAMSFLVLGGVTKEPVKIDDGSMIATSFPGFTDLMNGLGAKIEWD